MINKDRGDENAICLHFLPYVLNICRKFAFLISQQCKNFENRSTFDKVTDSLKVGTFLRHSVYIKLFRFFYPEQDGLLYVTVCNYSLCNFSITTLRKKLQLILAITLIFCMHFV